MVGFLRRDGDDPLIWAEFEGETRQFSLEISSMVPTKMLKMAEAFKVELLERSYHVPCALQLLAASDDEGRGPDCGSEHHADHHRSECGSDCVRA